MTRAAYYRFVGRGPSETKAKEMQVTQAIHEIRLEKHFDSYGSPRMHREELLYRQVCLSFTESRELIDP